MAEETVGTTFSLVRYNNPVVIDKEEIREGMRKSGMEEPSEQELMMIMNRCDSDGNGGIDIKEFEHLKSLKLHHLGQALLQEDRLDKVNKEDETPKKRKSRRNRHRSHRCRRRPAACRRSRTIRQ